ncbi:alpha/beta hydrolase [Methylomonas sp. EFPC3]|uniref:alpha/beta hydrolase n=1 Tax=Methylomonas sp. EFPC3 TaxID=3021710 RepID=UPI002415BC0A|nr:alpha/beta hydrolase [Methylomonas sp. EFPC3]WFP51144.1 alpha/beta hydrolase [Methylomonas sp. EFPC3]
MILISSRLDFTNSDALLPEGHIIKEIDITKDTTIREISIDTLLNELKDKNVCMLVHGYNNEHEEVRDAYQIIENNIFRNQDFKYDLIIGYSWPGGDRALEWWSAKSRANAVARRFRLLLELISKNTTVDVISHSLGARVCLKALKEASTILIRNYYCMAGAVDNESIEIDEEFNLSLSSLERLFIMHSAKDEVLASAYRLAEFDNALGLFGPEDKEQVETQLLNVFVANCKRVVTHHGGYKRSPAVFDYIATGQTQNPSRFITL